MALARCVCIVPRISITWRWGAGPQQVEEPKAAGRSRAELVSNRAWRGTIVYRFTDSIAYV